MVFECALKTSYLTNSKVHVKGDCSPLTKGNRN